MHDDAGDGMVDRRRLVLFLVVLAASLVPAITDPGAIARATAVVDASGAVIGAGSAVGILFFYGWVPLVALSACVLFLAPGLIASVAIGRADRIGPCLLAGFGISLVVISVSAGTVQALLGEPLIGARFTMLVVTLSAVAAVFLWRRSLTTGLPWPLAQRGEGVMLIWIVAGCWLLLVLLLPKFLWENMNGDGAHTLESSRLLLRQSVPFWDRAAGAASSWPGTSTMLFTYPASWFIRLMGPVEASVRLPQLIYLALFGGGVGALAHMTGRTLRGWDHALIWLSLTTFTIGMAFSATYSPYSADIALSLSQDVLVTSCVLGMIVWTEAGRKVWALLFGLFAYLAAPNGLLLILLWGASLGIVWLWWGRTAATGRSLRWTMIAIAASIVVGIGLPLLLRLAGLPEPGEEHGLAGILRRFAFLQVADWRRILYVVVPGGILPALSLVLWPRLDRLSRALALATAGYFLVFYVQAYIALHHFIPAMLLPLAVFWRGAMPGEERERHRWRVAYALTGIVALWLSLPRTSAIDTSARYVGAAIDNRLPGYEHSEAILFKRTELLRHLFAYDWDPRVPDQILGGSPLAWNYYSFHASSARVPKNYVIQPEDAPAPAGASLIRRADGAALFVLDSAVWLSHRTLRPATQPGSSIYAVPRWVLFRSPPPAGGPRILSVALVLDRLGVDTDRLLTRMGVRR